MTMLTYTLTLSALAFRQALTAALNFTGKKDEYMDCVCLHLEGPGKLVSMTALNGTEFYRQTIRLAESSAVVDIPVQNLPNGQGAWSTTGQLCIPTEQGKMLLKLMPSKAPGLITLSITANPAQVNTPFVEATCPGGLEQGFRFNASPINYPDYMMFLTRARENKLYDFVPTGRTFPAKAWGRVVKACPDALLDVYHSPNREGPCLITDTNKTFEIVIMPARGAATAETLHGGPDAGKNERRNQGAA